MTRHRAGATPIRAAACRNRSGAGFPFCTSEAVKQRERALDQRERQIEQAERKLVVTEEAHNRKTCEVFIKWAADEEARRIATSTASEPVKMKALMERMFGKRPDGGRQESASAGGGPPV